MNNFIKILMLFSVLLCYKIKAQNVIKKDTLSGTELTMTMDKGISQLLETSEDNCVRIASSSGPKSARDIDYTPRAGSTGAASPKVSVPSRALSRAEICRQNPRILGYKIQLIVVKSNEEAQEVKAYFRNRFPTIKAETDASLRPNYKILAGSYLTKESAASDLARVRQYFKSAIAVQYRVFCVEAK